MSVSNENQQLMHLHCGLCIEDFKAGKCPGESPQSYARLDVGWTEAGLQVWRVRHDCNVVNIDFQGAQHPADTTRSVSQTPSTTRR